MYGGESVQAAQGLAYHQIQKRGHDGAWRPLLGAFAVVCLLFTTSIGIVGAGAVVEAAVNGTTPDPADLMADPGPILLASLLLSIAVMVPLTMGVSWLLHGIGPGLLTSVAGRLRWRYLAGCLGLALVALLLTLGVSSLLPTGAAEELTAEPRPLDATLIAFLLVTIFLTPVQAAGEEYLFRGYLTQAFGRYLPTAVAVVGPALLFALAHGAQDLPVFIDRFAFGLVAGVLVVLTGGIEAGLAMHIVNNWMAFGLAVVLGDLGESLQPTDGTWWSLPGTLTQSLTYLVLAVWWARSQGVATRTVPQAPARL